MADTKNTTGTTVTSMVTADQIYANKFKVVQQKYFLMTAVNEELKLTAEFLVEVKSGLKQALQNRLLVHDLIGQSINLGELANSAILRLMDQDK